MIQLNQPSDLKGLKITVMGLGLNGGGLAAARFLAQSGALVTATDLRDEKVLAPTLKKLNDLSINYQLGKHEMADFLQADLVIKNPAIRKDSKYLQAARQIESDLSLFLRFCSNPIIAVTGSKGKSTTVSALYQMVIESGKQAFLGGNITISPLSFIDKTFKNPNAPVILELSSWQLSDIDFIEKLSQKQILQPEIAIITNIMHDHQNSYDCFDDYVSDKKVIYKNMDENSILICRNDTYGKQFMAESKSKTLLIQSEKRDPGDSIYLDDKAQGWIEDHKLKQQLIPSQLTVKGIHNRINLLQAAAATWCLGVDATTINKSAQCFSGIPYRMESLLTHQINETQVEWVNDSAATMPDAVLASCKSFTQPIYLISGGTDKELEFSPFKKLPANVKNIYLLRGDASDKIAPLLSQGKQKQAPFSSLKSAVSQAILDIKEQQFKKAILLLSPGAASFGMFKNEFDRGDQFVSLAKRYSNLEH